MGALFIAMFQVLRFWLRENRLAGLKKARQAIEWRLMAERHVHLHFAFLQWGRTVQVIPPPLIPFSDGESEESNSEVEELQEMQEMLTLDEDFQRGHAVTQHCALCGFRLNRFRWP